MSQSAKLGPKLCFIAAWIVLATLCAVPATRAATPYEAQLAGRVYAVLTTIIIGEFGGRTRANPHGTIKPKLCGPPDYEILEAVAKDNATLIEFRRRCALVTASVDEAYIYSWAHPPAGYCEKIKHLFETVLAQSGDSIIVEHKALRFVPGIPDTNILRRAQLQATCQDDGILRVRAPRKRKPTN